MSSVGESFSGRDENTTEFSAFFAGRRFLKGDALRLAHRTPARSLRNLQFLYNQFVESISDIVSEIPLRPSHTARFFLGRFAYCLSSPRLLSHRLMSRFCHGAG